MFKAALFIVLVCTFLNMSEGRPNPDVLRETCTSQCVKSRNKCIALLDDSKDDIEDQIERCETKFSKCKDGC